MNMEDDIERWTAKRKSARVRDIIQGKATIIEASRQYDLSASEVDQWIDDDKQGMENALRAKKLQSLLGEAGPGDRLPYPRVARLAYVA